ncbi:MAG: DUF3883 domain-containing protein [Bacteroidota bacterium]
MMNEQARQLLIDRAKLNVPIPYSVFMQQLGHLEHNQFLLTSTLKEIAEYEKEHNRPLLTAMAKYQEKEQWGGMFYELAEQLGYKRKEAESDKQFAKRMQNECHDYWKNKEQKLPTLQQHPIAVFTKEEITFLSNWAGKVYNKKNAEHVAAKNYIMNSLGSKTVYWSKKLVNILPDYETFNWRMWSQPGWDDSSGVYKRVAHFKHYTWARIYKKGDENKDIFFTIGVDSREQALVYKLDYYFESNSHLNASQKELINKNIPKNLRWNTINMNDLHQYGWGELINKVSLFIAENTSVYDELIKLAWGNTQMNELFTNHLRKSTPSLNRLHKLPVINPLFEGVTIDFISQAMHLKKIGDAGEGLVLIYEKNKLTALGKNHLADKVEKVKDGRGFDILSFNEDGKELYIEVKTTRGGENTSFDLSLNEYLFAKQHTSFCIYRLYNYDEGLNNADFFIIDNPLEKLLFQPTGFRVYYKV